MICINCNTGHMDKPQDGHPSYLICSNCGAYELTYNPQDYQLSLHREPIRTGKNGKLFPQILFVAGGYGSGKSKASLQEFFMRALENPNGTGLLTAPTLQQLKRTSIKTLMDEIIPPPFLESYNKSDMEIKLINGFTIYAVPSDDETKLRSLNIGLCHMEEASGIDKSIYVQLLTRLRDPNVKVKTMFVCTNPDGGWVRDTFVMNERRKSPKHPEHEDYNPFISCHIWPTKLNKYLPPNFAELASKGRPPWWKARFLEGSFDYIEGAVYPNFAKCIIDPIEIPKNWLKVIGGDHGLRNATAIVFGAIDPETSTLYLYKEYYKSNTLVPDHAKAIKPMIDEIPAGTLYRMVMDPSTANRTDPVNGKSVQALYQEYGIFWSMANNNLEAGILKVNSYIERGKLKVFHTLTNTVRDLINYKYPEVSIDDDRNLDEKPVKKSDHGADATRYLLHTLPDNPDDLKTISFSPPDRYNKNNNIIPELEDNDYEYRPNEKNWESWGY